MLLVIDVGNTNTVLGVYDDKKLVAHWRLTTEHSQTVDEYGILARNLLTLAQLDASKIDGVIISSVVPPLNATLKEMSERYFGTVPLFVEPGIKTGIRIHYENPQEVGADRIVNAVAAYEKYGGPCIVVDFGTAITFDAISRQGDYLGGIIAPGIGVSANALFAHTARLPRVSLQPPRKLIRSLPRLSRAGGRHSRADEGRAGQGHQGNCHWRRSRTRRPQLAPPQHRG